MRLVELIALVGFAVGPSEEWQRILPGITLEYPRDHGAHPSTRIEWWYVTGNLEAADGRHFGFQFTVFRQGLALPGEVAGSSPLRARQAFAGHLAVTNSEADETRFTERLRRGGSPFVAAGQDDLDLVLEDWSFARHGGDLPDGDTLRMLASESAGDTGGMGIELELVPAKPLILHGDGGYSAKGDDPGNASAYASWTRLETRGRLNWDGEWVDVVGQSWFDHEFGSSVLEEGVTGWDWFGLQLADGRDLMLFLLRRDDGRPPRAAGTIIAQDGTTRQLSTEDVELAALEEWVSPTTEARYPAAWSLRIGREGLDLEIRPRVADCELSSVRSTGVAYWEGPVRVSGSQTGRGYAELTGYAGSMDGRF